MRFDLMCCPNHSLGIEPTTSRLTNRRRNHAILDLMAGQGRGRDLSLHLHDSSLLEVRSYQVLPWATLFLVRPFLLSLSLIARARFRSDFTEFSVPPFSAAYFPGHGFGLIPAPGSFTASAFPVPPQNPSGSLPECSRSLWEQKPSLLGASGKWGKKGETQCT